MPLNLKKKIRSVINPEIKDLLKSGLYVLNTRKIERAKKAFKESNSTPEFLDYEQLELLHKKYPPISASEPYTTAQLRRRGKEYAKEVLKATNKHGINLENFLELGCYDGLVSAAIKREGKNAIAVDIRTDGFDEKAKSDGVKFYEMDATNLDFEDESFDVVFSYAALEHFDRPDKVFDEAIRVLRPGGMFYLNFGPIFGSPFGLHGYTSVGVPYCETLFREEDLKKFTTEKGLLPINFDDHVNRWKLEQYRAIWKKNESVMEMMDYREMMNFDHVNLVYNYPYCFKSKHTHFDELIISSISGLFKKV